MDQEFGIFPVAVDIYLGAYEGPVWEVAPFRFRSGWLMVSEARMITPFGTWKRPLFAAISDHGEVYAPRIAARLFDIPTSLPKCAECEPPEQLEEIIDGLYWDFLGSMDEEKLRRLQEEEERTDENIHAFEARCAAIEAEIWAAIRILRTELHREGITAARHAQIHERIAGLQVLPDKLVRALRRRTKELRQVTEDLGEAVLADLNDPAEIEPLFTVHWTAKGHRRGMMMRFPVFQEEAYSVDAWRAREQSDAPCADLNQEAAEIQFGAWR